MSQVFNMYGILRAKFEGGCMIERVKDGRPIGQAYSYALDKAKITQKALDAMKDLNVDDEIQYSMSDYVIQDIWKKGSRNNGSGGGFRGGSPKSPEERRSIELQSCLRTTADVFIAALQKSNAPVAMDFATMMKAIRAEAEISANWVRDQSKGVQ